MKKRIFGYELVLDLFDCGEQIGNEEAIYDYALQLCELIDMKRFGEPWIPYFGEANPITKGYTLVQLIETSSITGHFSEHWKTAYINIFSCKKFDADKAKEFTKAYFGAKRVKSRFLTR